MLDVKLYIGKVVDTDDPDEKSKIKVRLLPEMKDAQEDHLPWVYPFITQSMTEDSYTHNPPELDSLVWCFFTNESFHRGFYISALFLEDIFDYSVIEDATNDMDEIDSATYPQAKFTRYEDGTIVFKNTETGELGIYHSSGTYTVIDKDGGVFVNSAKGIKFYNDNGSIEVKQDGTIEQTNDSGAGVTFKITSTGFELNGNSKTLVNYEQLNTLLTTMFGLVDAAFWVDPLTGVAGPITAPTSGTLGTSISTIQVPNVKVP